MDDTNQFTREEKEYARTLMIRQQSLAAGYYNGPNSLQDEYVDPFGGDTLSKLGASIEYLERAHPEEKASVTYAFDRANAEGGYKLLAEKEGRPVEVEFSEDPLVRLIREAMESLQKSGHSNSSSGAILNADDLRDQDWFAPFLSRFDAISTSREGV
ncbi:hypothetical protein K1718_00120 [Roseibium porphyridii]|uniref:Uncharacterized protein n=1 Tax=Roseibium porphyridii TaxID=2866279 RepID=A0ABY8F2T6_9HYPH|nr:hypothetical protein [Roseibium sp. KMA01]WFE89802.1 hypothetical protein K1718_00120 [Roseibium sp. KMA01]